MKKFFILFSAILSMLFLTSPVFSWINTYGWDGADTGFDVVQMPGGDYLSVGSTKTLGGLESQLYYSLAFPIGFQYSYNTTGSIGYNDIGKSVTPTSDGGYIIAGTSAFLSGGSAYFYLVKLNNLKNFVWSKNFGEPGVSRGNSVYQAADNGYAMVGETSAIGAGGMDAYLVKTDSDGNSLWSRTYGWENNDYGNAILQASDGGHIIAGTSNSDMWIIKADANGNCVWSRTFGGPAVEECYSACNTSDGGYMLAGYTYSFGAGGKDVYLVKTDADGNCVWTRTQGGIDADIAHSIKQTSDGSYIIAGSSASAGPGPNNIYLLKVDSIGDFLWHKVFYGGVYDYGYSVKQTSDSGYIVAGTVNSFGSFGAGGTDMILIKTDANGVYNAPPTITVTKTVTLTKTVTMTPTITMTPTMTMTPTAMGYSWGGTGLWHEITDGAADTWTSQARPFTGLSPDTWWYGEEVTGTYFNSNVSNSGELTTPYIYINPNEAFYFWSWEQTEKRYMPGLSDTRKIYISGDSGATWTHLKECFGTEDQWYRNFVDLTAYSGQFVIFKFVFDTVDVIENSYRGWFLDEMQLGPLPTPSVTPTDTPICSPTNTTIATPTATHMVEADWTLSIANAAFSGRVNHSSVEFGGKMWVIGGVDGTNYFNDAWYSNNGSDWFQATSNAAFEPRYGQSSVVFNNDMYVIAGRKETGVYVKDVYKSANGVDWTVVTLNAGFISRSGHTSVVFDNKIWVIGGYGGIFRNDIWYTSNGTDWFQATANAAFSGRSLHTSVVFDNKIWVIGGTDGVYRLNDVWYSSDGITWTQATAAAAFLERYRHSSVVYNGKMWVIGGVDQSMYQLNDVWWSADGINWLQSNTSAAWSARGAHTSVVFGNKMWVIAGTAGARQVWYSPPGPLPTQTETGTMTQTLTPVMTQTQGLTDTITPTLENTVTQTLTYTATEELTLTQTPTVTLSLTSTPTQTPTMITETAAFYYVQAPVLYPNPSTGSVLHVMFTASKTVAEFRMRIYTMGYRRVREIKRYNLPPVNTIITAGIEETGGMATGLYYYVITIEDNNGAVITRPISHLVVIR